MYPSYCPGPSADALKLTAICADAPGFRLIALELSAGAGAPPRPIAASWKTVEPDPRLEIVRLCDRFGFPSPPWKLHSVGAAAAVAFNAAAMFRIPAPAC